MDWKKPKTIKLYLHPPEANRLITLWPDFKIISAHVDPQKNTNQFKTSGFRFLFGKNSQVLEWQNTLFKVRNDGIPIQKALTDYNGFHFEIETFCSWEDIPDTYVRLTIINKNNINKKLVLGVMPRTGTDAYFYGITGDFYASYEPNLEQWDMIPATFSFEKNFLRDNDSGMNLYYFVPIETDIYWINNNKKNIFAKEYLEISTLFSALETKVFYFLMTEKNIKNTLNEEKYRTARLQIISKWQKEINKVQIIPNVPGKKMKTMVYSLICQCLQMFTKGDNGHIRPRQGGRWSGVWPVEAIEFLMVFDHIGLNDWAEKGYRFFRECQIKEGKDKGKFTGYLSPVWENITGWIFYGLAYHLRVRNDIKYFQDWKQCIIEGLDWIQSRRAETKQNQSEPGYGLMPAGNPHDWGLNVQAWCWTDASLYMGIRDMAKTFTYFNDPSAKQFMEIADDYRLRIIKVLETVCTSQKDRNEIFIPNYLGVKEKYPPAGPYFIDGPVSLIRAGIIDPESELFTKVEKYFRNRGWIKNGLTGLMTDSLLASGIMSDPWAGHTWYVSIADICWFFAWLKRKEYNKARMTLKAQMLYGMSSEFYMQERYSPKDLSFCPWQPNASANGRLIQMLFEFYGECFLKSK
jgi:hypothetical protein